MTNRDIVLEYLKCFCEGDISGVEAVLALNLQLTGPLYTFKSRDEYIQSLKEDPPKPSRYRILEIAESETGISVFYEYNELSGCLTIAQFFKLRGEKILEILLVFDTKCFS